MVLKKKKFNKGLEDTLKDISKKAELKGREMGKRKEKNKKIRESTHKV